jgi:hypothetical protein
MGFKAKISLEEGIGRVYEEYVGKVARIQANA